MTVRDLITASILDISAIGQGQPPNNSELARNFDILNTMILGWNLARENIYSLQEEVFALVNGVQSYTMGPAGTLSATRPASIQNAAFRISGTTVAMPLNLLTGREWNSIPDRLISGNVLKDLYYDYGFPLGTISLNPIPIGNPALLLMVWIPFTSFASLDVVVSLPDPYLQALEYGLAVRIAPGYGLQVPKEVADMAQEFKANMQKFNAEHVFGMTKQETIPSVGIPQSPNPAA